MFNRKKLDREKLEVYFVYLLLAARPLLMICGIFLSVYSFLMTSVSYILSGLLFSVAVYLFILSYSYPVVLFSARLGAWIATLRERDI
jgi:hypothetical protein